MRSVQSHSSIHHFQKSVLCLLVVLLAALGFVGACATQDPDQNTTSQTSTDQDTTHDDTNTSNTNTSNTNNPTTRPSFVAHEWGTYTSVQDSTGASLDGLHHTDEYLPPFVHMRHIASPQSKGVEILPTSVNQKLETPVIYFYTDRPRTVRVQVDFPQGVISEWYPQAASFLPAIGTLEDSGIANGSMTWDVEVSADINPELSPAVEPDSVWAPSRRTAATPLRVTTSAGVEVEQFIFYRGLGRFDGPVSVRSTLNGSLEVHNTSPEPIPDAFLLHVHDGGGFVIHLGDIAANGAITAEPSPKEINMDAYVEQASAEIEQALIRSGLYPDEARAMVETWSHSYFRTPGLRVLYVAPKAWTDALLPLQISPQPDEIVRTLIGRVEVLTPPVEFEVAALVSQVQSGLLTREALFARLGRFAEPKLRRALTLITDPATKAYCETLVQEAQAIR